MKLNIFRHLVSRKKSSNLCILFFIPKGAYRDGQLISWCLTKFSGSIGTVFTTPEARGLGLATILNTRLLSKLFELQERAFCYISDDNIASLRVFEKLGFHKTCLMDWVVFTPE